MLLAFALAFHVDHTPPACVLADKSPRVVACLTPRSTKASVRVLFRAEGSGEWYAAPMRYELPCYQGVLPRPSRSTGRIAYVVEAQAGGITARSAEHQVPVAADAGSCPGRPAPVADGPRASWEAPPGAPRTPPGFEGSRVKVAAAEVGPPAAAPVTQPPAVPPVARPAPKTPPPAPTARPRAAKGGGGHGARNALLAVVGAGAAGGAAVAVSRRAGEETPATTLGSGLPATGVSGVYVGSENVTYSGNCTGVDDVVLNLQGSEGLLSGVLTFTVRTCPCCAAGRGANPVSGSLSGTNLQFQTPEGFAYSGSFAGNRLSGSLTGPGGVTGTWTVDKR